MPSPFPGMNPYLEKPDDFHSFHEQYIVGMVEALNPGLEAAGYFAMIDQFLYIHELGSEERQYFGRPGVSVHTQSQFNPPTTSGSTLIAPAFVGPPPSVDVERLSFIEIRDRRSRSVVTAIELLSPTNKYVGADREQYLAKQQRLLKTMTNFVEIDLLRGGPRMPWEGMPECDYYALVSRYTDRTRAAFWPLRLRDRLPEIPIPLREDEPTVLLDLQAVLHRVYDGGGYRRFLYDEPPQPRLSPADAAWAEEIIRGVVK